MKKILSTVLALAMAISMSSVAFAEETTTKSTVTRDPGNTGGTNCEFDSSSNTFSGTIDYYEADVSLGRTAGYRVGVQITAPTDISIDNTKATFKYTDLSEGEKTLTGTAWLSSGENFVYYYPLVTSAGQNFTVKIDWDGLETAYTEETITIKIASYAKLKTTEITRTDDSVIQDPGYTGGRGLDYSFNTSSKTLTISDKTDSDEKVPLTTGGASKIGNWVGVAIKAPTNFTGDISSLKINDETYTQPILSDLEKSRSEMWYYFDANTSTSNTLVIDWGCGYAPETITVTANSLDLEKATDPTDPTDPTEPTDPTPAPTTDPTPTYTPDPHAKTATTANIADVAKNLKDGDKLTIKATTETKSVSADVLKEIKGKDVEVKIEIADGIEWSFNGKDIPSDWDAKDINFNLDTANSQIPADTLKTFTAGKQSKTLSLDYDGAFGFEMTLTVHIGYLNDGQYANVYYYNPETKTLEFKGSSKINSAGNAKFDFEHASDYVILVSDKTATSSDKVDMTTNDTTTTDDEANPKTGETIPVALIIAILSVATIAVVSKKRKFKVVK